MALSHKHRTAIYEHLAPHLGDEVTEAFMAEFPAHDGDEFVTKSFLRAELAEQSAELRAEMYRLHHQTVTTVVAVAGVMTAVLAIVN
jgi:hypothetical protein